MADDLAFDTEKCPVDPVTRIPPCENLLRDPRVDDAPPEISDCLPEPLALPPEPPCPDLSAKSQFNYGGTPDCNPPRLLFTITPGKCCDFDIEIDLDIPCPVFAPIYPQVEDIPWTLDRSELRFGFNSLSCDDKDGCDFDLEIDIKIHCPQMTADGGATATKSVGFGTGVLTFGFTQVDDNCDWDLDIAVDVPCPPLEPVVPVSKAVSFGTGTLAFGFTKGDGCDYTLDIDVDVPCPPIGPTTPTVVTATPTEGTPTLTFSFTKGSGCDYTLDIAFEYACPAIGPTTPTVVTATLADAPPTLTFFFTKGSGCDYTLDIAFEYAYPDIQPQGGSGITRSVSFVDGPGHLTYVFVPGPGGVYTLEIDLAVPCPVIGPTVITESAVTYSVTPKVVYYFTKLDGCEYELTVSVTVPCPAIGPTTPAFVYLYSAQGVQGYVSWAFAKTGACEYELDIDALVPCVYIKPQVSTVEPIVYSGTTAGSLTYRFAKSSTDCEYTLIISDIEVPCPEDVTVDVNVSVTMIASDEAASGTGAMTYHSCWDFTLDLDLNIPRGYQGYQGSPGTNCTCPPTSPAIVLAPSLPPVAKLPTGNPGTVEYGVASPVYMPEQRVADQVVMLQRVPVGAVQELRRKLDPAYLTLCNAGTVEVVSVVPDRAAVVGGRVEGDEVVVEVSPLGNAVHRVLVVVSGTVSGRPARYRPPTDIELSAIEAAEAGDAGGPPDFNY